MPQTNFLLRALAAVHLLVALACGQCQYGWLAGQAAAGPSGPVDDLLLHSTGDLIAVGNFPIADGSVCNGLARWDGVAWHALGAGVDGSVSCVAEAANGDLVVGGSFTQAGGQPAQNIAVWNGSSWSSYGPGLSGPVSNVLVMPNGDIVACGNGFNANIYRVARWNGSTWSQVGQPPLGDYRALAVAPNGDLLAGGYIGASAPTDALIRFDGTAWNVVPGFTPHAALIEDMISLPNGSVICVGNLATAAGAASTVSFDGTTLQDLNAPLPDALHVTTGANGSIVVLRAGQPSLASWDGASWTMLPDAPLGSRNVVTDSGGNVVVGAITPTNSVQRLSAGSWQTVGAPSPPSVRATVKALDGSVYIGGTFSALEGVAANNIVRWNDSSYAALGQGVDGEVRDVASNPDGTLIVGGSFTMAGGAAIARVARWDGQSWTALGSGFPGTATVHKVAVAPDGTVYCIAGGLWRYDSSGWAQLATSTPIPILYDLAVLPSGELVVGGTAFLPSAGGFANLLLIDSSGVSPFPGSMTAGLSDCRQVLITNNGDLLIGGGTTARWDGVAWTILGSGLTNISELPNGDLICATISSPDRLVRYSQGVVTAEGPVTGSVTTTAVSGDGDLFIGGPILTVAGQVSAGFAHAEPACRAVAGSVGVGCVGASGPVTVTATTLPWIGSDYVSTAHGMAAVSLAVQALGSPIPAVPLGGAGCQLIVSPLITAIAVSASGQATFSVSLPNDPALVGAVLREQVVGVELSIGGNITALTTSNALDLTIGSL